MKQTQATMISFDRPDGGQVQGYLALPHQQEDAPAIIVIQEWWGLNDQIRGVADRLAAAGYIALVPDLYRGKMTVEQEEAHHLMDGLDFGDAIGQDIRGALNYLRQGNRRVGVTGFCMGGALSWLAVSQLPELSAAAVWYGMPPLEAIDVAAIKVPVQAHWATQDAFFPIDTVDQLDRKLADAGVDYKSHRYLAHHAFANETAVGQGRIPNTQYDPAWTQTAWDRALTFFARTLWRQPA